MQRRPNAEGFLNRTTSTPIGCDSAAVRRVAFKPSAALSSPGAGRAGCAAKRPTSWPSSPAPANRPVAVTDDSLTENLNEIGVVVDLITMGGWNGLRKWLRSLSD
jgi:hypothetical protein